MSAGNSGGQSFSGRILPYLRLVRAPAVFSALGDPLAGALIAGGDTGVSRAATVALSAGSTYLAGMALNDVADLAEDQRERPHRPIPSGAITRERAAWIGGGLLAGGMLGAAAAGAPRTGTALALSVAAYDFALKSGPLGPVAMGACRSLSLLTGAEAAGGMAGVRRAAVPAAILGSYVAGLTLLARGETESGGNRSVAPGVVLGMGAVAAAVGRGGVRALPWGAAVAVIAGGAALRAAREPSPGTVGPAVGAMIRAIPALDAALSAPRAPLSAALIAAPLLALSRWGRRLIPIS